MNALSDALFDDLIHASTALNENERIGSIVITGKGKAFAAGADISEMSEKEFADVYKSVRTTSCFLPLYVVLMCIYNMCIYIICAFYVHIQEFFKI